MRQLLRRALAFAITLSVMLSTLGVAHASCDAMGHGASAPAARDMDDMGDMAGMAHHDAPMPAGCEHMPTAPADHGGGAGCMLVAHCSVPMLASRSEVALATPRVQEHVAPTDDTGPRWPALEPDSPPPRA